MFATQRLAASATGVCWAGAWQVTGIDRDSFPHGTRRHDGHRPGLVPARDSPGTTGIDRDSGRTGLGARRRALRTTGYRTRPARRAPRTTGVQTRPARRASRTTGVRTRPARRAPGTTGDRTRPARRAPGTTSDRTRPARVRHGRHGSPVFPRIDTHEW